MKQAIRTGIAGAIVLLSSTACTPLWETSGRRIRNQVDQRSTLQEAAQATEEAPPTVPASVPDLDALVSLALERTPERRAARLRLLASAKAVHAAGHLPEPRLEISPIGAMAETAAGEVTIMTRLSQGIPKPGLLGAEIAQAEADLLAQEARNASLEVRIAREVRDSHAAWRQAGAVLDLVAEQTVLLEDLRHSIGNRLAINAKRRQAELLRLEVELAGLANDRLVWEEQRAIAEVDLRRWLDLDPDTAIPTIDTLANEAIDDVAIDSKHPDLQANDAAQGRAVAQERRASALRLPAFGVGIAYNVVDDNGLSRLANGDDQWWVGFTVSIPLWADQYRANEYRARMDRWASRAERAGIQRRIERDILAAEIRHASLISQLSHYNDSILPGAEDAFRAEERAFASNNGSYEAVTRAWQQWLMHRIQSLRLERQLAANQAALLAAAGLVYAPEESP